MFNTKCGFIQPVANFGSEFRALQFVESPKAAVHIIKIQNTLESKKIKSFHAEDRVSLSLVGLYPCLISGTATYPTVKKYAARSKVPQSLPCFQTKFLSSGSEVLTTVVMNISLFENVTPCCMLRVNRLFGGTCWLTFNTLHDVIFSKTQFFKVSRNYKIYGKCKNIFVTDHGGPKVPTFSS
jgi:hypothetical protein